MIAPTDEPEVTDDTRFVLYWQIVQRHIITDEQGWVIGHRYGKRVRVEAVVSEATYRAAYAAAISAAPDVHLPLDEHWWSTRDVAWDRNRRVTPTWAVSQMVGGYIDWWGS